MVPWCPVMWQHVPWTCSWVFIFVLKFYAYGWWAFTLLGSGAVTWEGFGWLIKWVSIKLCLSVVQRSSLSFIFNLRC